MASGDLFKRQGLLPSSRLPTDTDDDGDSEQGIFDRPTAVPDLPPDKLAKQAMGHSSRPPAGTPPRSGTDGPHSEEAFEVDAAALESVPPPRQPISSLPPMLAPTQSDGFSLPPPARDAILADNPLHFVDSLPRRPLEVPQNSYSTHPPPIDPSQDLPLVDSGSNPPSLSDLYAVGDFTGALDEAERRLMRDPGNEMAENYAARCREVLLTMHGGRLGALDQIVSISVPPDQLRWLAIDHRAGFLLSLMETPCSLEELLDLCGMDRLDAIRILTELQEKGVIRLSPPPGA